MSGPRQTADLMRDRDRDIAARVKQLEPLMHGGVAVTAASLAVAYGWRAAAVFALIALGFNAFDPGFRPFARWPSSRPGIVFAAVMVAVASALSGGPHSHLVVLFAMPVVVASAHLLGRRRLVVLAAIEVCLVAACLSAGVAELLADPSALAAPTVLLMMVAIVVSALADSDSEHRGAATLDPLTGLLNRHGLTHRFPELAAQAQRSGRPISVAVIDIDSFKTVNDEHGHGRGDDVLRHTAAVLGDHLRPFELAYRIGGDEFVVVLPDVGLDDAAQVADRLCRAVRAARPGGLPVTVTIGVGCDASAELGYERLFAEADAALYRAKAAGRDRVEPAPGVRLAAA
jgi:diguanylate cyclase (GGDEF)-like protein